MPKKSLIPLAFTNSFKKNEGPSDKADGKLTIRPTTGTVQSLRTSGLITRLIAICWDSLLTRYGSYDETDIFQTGVR